MRRLSRYLKREWEQAACILAGVLLLAFLVNWAVSRRAEDLRAGSSRIAEPPSVLGPGAFAFLEGTSPAPMPERNPFLSGVIARPVPRPERPVRRDPPRPAVPPPAPVAPPPAPTPAPDVVATPAEAPTPPPAPTPAGPRFGQSDLRYVFSTVNRSGRPVAVVEFHDPSRPGGAPSARNVSAGDVVYGLRIQSFSDEALILTDAAGRRQSVSLGGSRRVTVEMGNGP